MFLAAANHTRTGSCSVAQSKLPQAPAFCLLRTHLACTENLRATGRAATAKQHSTSNEFGEFDEGSAPIASILLEPWHSAALLPHLGAQLLSCVLPGLGQRSGHGLQR